MKRLLLTFLALVAMTTGSQAQNMQNGHEYVDLGLPSGTMWATCNIGADVPTFPGDKFAWGETEPKEMGTWQNYKFGTPYFLTKYTSRRGWPYNDNKIELDDTDDAARVNWGGTWRMPTIIQIKELVENSNISTQVKDVGNNKKVIITQFTSKLNGKSITLPLSNYVDVEELEDAYRPAYEFYYFSRTSFESPFDDQACGMYFLSAYIGDDYYYQSNIDRFIAACIRPVFVVGEVAPTHTHSYASEWRMNANTHWHVCESPLGVCQATKSGEAVHTYNSDNTCTICGYTNVHTQHYYSDDWVWYMDANTHWHGCENPCGICDAPKKDEAAHDFNERYGYCSVCYYIKPTTPHTHSYANTWSWNESTHWHACTSTEGYCDTPKADEAAHIFDANKICTVCGYEGYMEYGFSVYNTEVTSQNKNDILGNGVFSYLPETKTLSVRGNHLSPRYGNILVNESVEGLVVNISGNVTLSALTGFLSHSDMTITGPGHLTVSTQMTTTDMMDGSKLVIKDKIIEPVDGYVKDGDVVDASGNLATEVVIAKNGDANLDGVVDIADVVAVLNAMANDSNAPQFKVNDDNVVDIADVVAVLNIMAQQ